MALFFKVDQVIPVSFKGANLLRKLQKGSVHINRMKEYFTYDDPPIDSPPQPNSTGEPSEDNYKLLELFTESPDDGQIGLVDSMLLSNPQNVKQIIWRT